MKVMAIGDVVGSPGRRAIRKMLPAMIGSEGIDFVVANGENAAGGSGLTPKIVDELLSSGIDVITSGDHIWKKAEMIEAIDDVPMVLRPENYPDGSPGSGHTVANARNGRAAAVLNLVGRVFMQPAECPFRAADRVLPEIYAHTRVILVDMHCEATSEKIAMGWHLDGRTSLVFGTHTHIQTADERVLPNGTAYITDLGMTGPYDSVIGRKKESVLRKFVTNLPEKFDVADGDVRMCGVIATIDEATGRAGGIQRFAVAER